MKQLKYLFYFLEKQGVKSNGSYFRHRVGEVFTYPSHTTGHAGLAPSGSN